MPTAKGIQSPRVLKITAFDERGIICGGADYRCTGGAVGRCWFSWIGTRLFAEHATIEAAEAWLRKNGAARFLCGDGMKR